jgi:hypothetical protein
VVEKTASGRWPGNLNARDAPPTARTVYLAYKKGDGPPITDLAIYFKVGDVELLQDYSSILHLLTHLTFFHQREKNLNPLRILSFATLSRRHGEQI